MSIDLETLKGAGELFKAGADVTKPLLEIFKHFSKKSRAKREHLKLLAEQVAMYYALEEAYCAELAKLDPKARSRTAWKRLVRKHARESGVTKGTLMTGLKAKEFAETPSTFLD